MKGGVYKLAQIVRTTTWTDNQVLTAAALNGEFDNALNALNIDNDDIAAGAAIAGSKLAVPATGTFTIPTVKSYTPSASATQDLDLSESNDHKITMPAGNITLTVSSATAGEKFLVSITQDGTGSRTVTWFDTISWAGGSAPTLTTTGSKTDVFGFVATGTTTFQGFVVGQNI